MDRSIKDLIEYGARFLVVGLGKSGIAAVRFLLKMGARISVSEGGRQEQLDQECVRWLKGIGVQCEFGGHTSAFFDQAECILVSPGVPTDMPEIVAARQRGIPVFGELALAEEFLEIPVVAVTGTNGKSTVTTLIGEILKAAGRKVFVGGNIGTPLAEYLCGKMDCDCAVLEVSSFQLDTAGRFRARVGVLLNITPDHLDRYPSFEAYADSKFSLFSWQKKGDAAVLNADDPLIRKRLGENFDSWANASALHVFSRSSLAVPGAVLGEESIELVVAAGGTAEKYMLPEGPLREAFNVENAAAAVLAARIMGCSPAAVRSALSAFTPLPHRLSLVASIGGVTFYDDSKATNIGSAVAALRAMRRPVVLIAGGRDKGGDYALMREAVSEKARAVVLIGEASGKIASSLSGLTEIRMASTMDDAVQQALQVARQGDAVLLAPACASFDMFTSYAHRGEVFRKCVKELVTGSGDTATVKEMARCGQC